MSSRHHFLFSSYLSLLFTWVAYNTWIFLSNDQRRSLFSKHRIHHTRISAHSEDQSDKNVRWVLIGHFSGNAECGNSILSTWFRPGKNVGLIAIGNPPAYLQQSIKVAARNSTLTEFQKTREGFRLALKTFPYAKAFARFDDDSYVYTRELWKRVSVEEPVYAGYIVKKDGLFFASGGAGYVLSQEAAAIVAECPGGSPYEDVGVAICLRSAPLGNITVSNMSGFHPHHPYQMLRWDRTGHPSDHVVPGDETRLQGYMRPISYHHITPSEMLRMHDDVYQHEGSLYRRRPPPRILHQIWEGDQAARPTFYMQGCRDVHPHWRYMLWNNETIAQRMPSTENASGPPTFDRLDGGIGRMINREYYHGQYHQMSDILRYEILMHYGGLFLDADSQCLRPFDQLIDDVFLSPDNNGSGSPQAIAFLEKDDDYYGGLVANGVIVTYPYSPLAVALTSELRRRDLTRITWVSTGPLYFTEVIKRFAGGPLPVRVLPSRYTFPLHWHLAGAPQTHQSSASERLHFELLIAKGSITDQKWGTTKKGLNKSDADSTTDKRWWRPNFSASSRSAPNADDPGQDDWLPLLALSVGHDQLSVHGSSPGDVNNNSANGVLSSKGAANPGSQGSDLMTAVERFVREVSSVLFSKGAAESGSQGSDSLDLITSVERFVREVQVPGTSTLAKSSFIRRPRWVLAVGPTLARNGKSDDQSMCEYVSNAVSALAFGMATGRALLVNDTWDGVSDSMGLGDDEQGLESPYSKLPQESRLPWCSLSQVGGLLGMPDINTSQVVRMESATGHSNNSVLDRLSREDADRVFPQSVVVFQVGSNDVGRGQSWEKTADADKADSELEYFVRQGGGGLLLDPHAAVLGALVNNPLYRNHVFEGADSFRVYTLLTTILFPHIPDVALRCASLELQHKGKTSAPASAGENLDDSKTFDRSSKIQVPSQILKAEPTCALVYVLVGATNGAVEAFQRSALSLSEHFNLNSGRNYPLVLLVSASTRARWSYFQYIFPHRVHIVEVSSLQLQPSPPSELTFRNWYLNHELDFNDKDRHGYSEQLKSPSARLSPGAGPDNGADGRPGDWVTGDPAGSEGQPLSRGAIHDGATGRLPTCRALGLPALARFDFVVKLDPETLVNRRWERDPLAEMQARGSKLALWVTYTPPPSLRQSAATLSETGPVPDRGRSASGGHLNLWLLFLQYLRKLGVRQLTQPGLIMDSAGRYRGTSISTAVLGAAPARVFRSDRFIDMLAYLDAAAARFFHRSGVRLPRLSPHDGWSNRTYSVREEGGSSDSGRGGGADGGFWKQRQWWGLWDEQKVLALYVGAFVVEEDVELMRYVHVQHERWGTLPAMVEMENVTSDVVTRLLDTVSG